MEKNKDTTPKDEYEKYKQQYDYVKQIVGKYDDPNFDEKDEKQATEIVDLMQKVNFSLFDVFACSLFISLQSILNSCMFDRCKSLVNHHRK